jgi:phosphatidylglycerophosphate synthase
MTPTSSRRANVIRLGALAIGIILFIAALYYINITLAVGTVRKLGVALPLALVFSGLWHLARTWAWAQCFPQPRRVSFLRLARVRLAAEAFSYLTLRGIAGEPLKVVLLGDRVDAREATAAVALERMAYMIVTTVIVGVGSVMAILMLPLTRLWFKVFRAFALTALGVTVLAGIVISGRGAYMQGLLLRIDRLFGSAIAQGRISRFLAAVERQMLDLVRGNPRRLLVLTSATVAAYIFMALEAWVILRASGTPVSAAGAMTVETFSRVASFASAFIPANLGALEASSLAAVAAIGVAGGGAALALARRIRGLFWAGIGLAIYPRGTQRVAALREVPAAPGRESAQRPVLFYLPRDRAVEVSPKVRFAGMALGERVVRAAVRAGYAGVIVWEPEGTAGASPRLFADLAHDIGGMTVVRTSGQLRTALTEFEATGDITIVGAGTLVSPALLGEAASMRAGSSGVRDVPAGDEWPVSGVIRMNAAAVTDLDRVNTELAARRTDTERPTGEDVALGRARLALRIVTIDDIAPAERHLRRSSYKDTDGNVARFNRRISVPISVALIPTPLTANQLSVILVAVGFYSGWLFSIGHYWTGVLAAFLSLAASVLDGCDGEIARLKYQESALGCWIETVGDYSYYVAIFIGITFGAVQQTGWGLFYWIGIVALGGTFLTFALLIYLRSRITGGQPARLHGVARERFNADPSLWTRITWNLMFIATRAAMPYGIMVFALCYLMPAIIVLAAICSNLYWATLVMKLRDLLRGDEEEIAAA